MGHLTNLKYVFVLTWFCAVLAACLEGPEPPNRPCDENAYYHFGVCHPLCGSSVSNGLPCAVIGQSCTRPVDEECEYKAVCGHDFTWTGLVTCGEFDAGTMDAGSNDAGNGQIECPPANYDPSQCAYCAYFITDPCMLNFCGTTPPLYDTLMDCMCNRGSADIPPGCKDECGTNFCAGSQITQNCGICVQTGYCSTEFGMCAADL